MAVQPEIERPPPTGVADFKSEWVADLPRNPQTTKERGELDVLVRDNTWIFGEGFHITMPEAGLTKIMDRVSQELALKRAKGARTRKLDGSIGRIDSFMGREVPKGNRLHREYLLIELKRPSLTVGRKELDQLDDYVTAIIKQPDYVPATTTWNFFLVTTESSPVIAHRINQEHRAPSLYIDGANYKVWVKPVGRADPRLRRTIGFRTGEAACRSLRSRHRAADSAPPRIHRKGHARQAVAAPPAVRQCRRDRHAAASPLAA